MSSKILGIIGMAAIVVMNGAVEAQESLRRISEDGTRWVAHAQGARAEEKFCVVDEDGVAVSGAKIAGAFGLASGIRRAFSGETDTNGCFSVCGISSDGFWFRVMKDGYYSSRGEKVYVDTKEVPAVKDGKWQPYGEVHNIHLKKVHNPVKLVRTSSQRYFPYPPLDEWVGFDFEKMDWVSPVGRGNFSDMLVRISRREENEYLMDVSFTNNPFAGVYEMKCDEASDMKTVYVADTNHVYASSKHYSRRLKSSSEDKCELEDGQYLVFRTRTSVDNAGRVSSCHYGVIFGNWRFCEKGGMTLKRIIFNLNENDANLEDSEIARMSGLISAH